jgi:hypothetical protein
MTFLPHSFDLYSSWFSELPEGHCSAFVEWGLRPMLKRYGYSLGETPKRIARWVEEWAFAHVVLQHSPPKPMLERVFSRCLHSGGEDEFDWFCQQIPSDAWHTLCTQWSAPEFLDSSDAGAQQCADLQHFAWKLIDLQISKAHTKYMNALTTMNQVDEELYGVAYNQQGHGIEDSQPSSRRTFSTT